MLTNVKALASEYCKNSSAHGVHYVVSSSNTAKKLGWMLILCGVLAGSSYHIFELISSYLEYNYYTSITLDTRKPLTVNIYITLAQKALNGIHWEVAHPLMLNYGAPIASTDATMCVSSEGTSYVGIVT